MYRCEVCERITEPGEKQQTIVETRPVEYARREKVYWRPPRDGEKGKWLDDPGGTGAEIARELRVCRACKEERSAVTHPTTGRTSPTTS